MFIGSTTTVVSHFFYRIFSRPGRSLPNVNLGFSSYHPVTTANMPTTMPRIWKRFLASLGQTFMCVLSINFQSAVNTNILLVHSNLLMFQDVILLTDATKRPSRETKDEFKQMISLPTKCHLFRQAVTLSSSELGGNYSKFVDDMIGFYIPYRVTHTISYVLLRIRFLGLNLQLSQQFVERFRRIFYSIP